MVWIDYYKNNYLKILEEFKVYNNNKAEEDLLCSMYVKLFNSACELLKMYLNYQGLFQFENREVIKEAFSVELINDGERWINALSLAEVYESGEVENLKSLILFYCEDKNFYIFEELKNKFEKLKEEYV